MKKIKLILASVAVLVGVVALVPSYAMAAPADEIKQGVTDSGGNDDGGSLPSRIKDIVNVLLFILGAIAVIMIVIGGIRYATSNGESASIKSAKDTILYAVIGLIVAILAYSIVNFIVDSFI